MADVQQNGRQATRSSYTSITTCISCGRVTFGGVWQDIGDGLQGYLGARADTNSICPRCTRAANSSRVRAMATSVLFRYPTRRPS
jgi:hypothetical protein